MSGCRPAQTDGLTAPPTTAQSGQGCGAGCAASRDMQGNTQVEQLAAFAQAAAFDDLSNTVLDRLKLHILDTLGCAMGALGTGPTQAVRRASDKLGGSETGPCSLIGGGRAARWQIACTGCQ